MRGLFDVIDCGNITIVWLFSADEIEKDVSTEIEKGVKDLWTSVNHVALVVSDIGISLGFYADVVGMTQVHRPNFDRQVY